MIAEHKFKIGMFLNELQLPLEEALAVAKEIGVEYVWFSRLIDLPTVIELSDAEIDNVGSLIDAYGLKHLQISAGVPFKSIDLINLDIHNMAEHPEFRRDFDNLVTSMKIANRLNVGAVSVYGFAWPGEYTAGKPTWPMRWLTRGGVISEGEMAKIVKAFTMVADEAEKYDVDVVVMMMPWNYTNTTVHFREVAQRVGSSRIRVMWGPADNYNSGELDVADFGFMNVQPYLHSLHIKDLRINDGIALDFEYVPFGEGDVDYTKVLRTLRETRSNAVLSVATHWTSPNGSRIEAMRTNFVNLMSLIRDAST